MARPRTGQLILRKSGYVARYWTQVDGEWVRKTLPLGTLDRAAAKAKLRRLMGRATAPDPEQSARPETYSEAFERINAQRTTDGIKDSKNEAGRHKLHVAPIIGSMLVTEIRFTHVKAVLDTAKDKGLARETLKHVRKTMQVTFDVLWRDGTLSENPVPRVKTPKGAKVDARERAVLTDEELIRYLAWEHPDERHREAVRERQTMACVARMLGGMRTGDLHAIQWEALDPGRFEVGVVPRKKTASPQPLVIPAMLRPILRDWWERTGRPTAGLVFPIRRGAVDDEKRERVKSSHAKALRRDLRRAFGVDHWIPETKDDGTLTGHWEAARPLTARETELLEGTTTVKPTEFHSFRRAFAQGLADAGLNAQEAQKLTGHASLAAHGRYLANTRQARIIPDAALPQIDVSLNSGPKLLEPANDTEKQTACSSLNHSWAGQVSNLRHPACKGAEQPEAKGKDEKGVSCLDTGFPALLVSFRHGPGLNPWGASGAPERRDPQSWGGLSLEAGVPPNV